MDAQTWQEAIKPFKGLFLMPGELDLSDEALKGEQGSDMQWQTQAGTQWQPGETEGMRVYSCNSCGGEIVGDETTAATECPFCGNPVVMMGQFSGALKPMDSQVSPLS